MGINASAATRHTAYSIHTKHPRHQEDKQHERPCARASVSRAWVLGSDGTENPGFFSCLPSSRTCATKRPKMSGRKLAARVEPHESSKIPCVIHSSGHIPF